MDPAKGENTLTRLKAALKEHSEWPNVYVFKFIVPKDQLNRLLAILDGMPVSTRESAAGRYIGVTSEVIMETPAEVIAVYEKVVGIEGLLSF